MTPAGWLFLISSAVFIISLTSYSFWKILTIKK